VSGLGNEKSEVLRALLTKEDLNNLLIGVWLSPLPYRTFDDNTKDRAVISCFDVEIALSLIGGNKTI